MNILYILFCWIATLKQRRLIKTTDNKPKFFGAVYHLGKLNCILYLEKGKLKGKRSIYRHSGDLSLEYYKGHYYLKNGKHIVAKFTVKFGGILYLDKSLDDKFLVDVVNSLEYKKLHDELFALGGIINF